MTIRFIKNYIVNDAKELGYVKGEILNGAAASEKHFVNRGVAEYVPAGTKRTSTKKPVEETAKSEEQPEKDVDPDSVGDKSDKGTSKLMPGKGKGTGNK